MSEDKLFNARKLLTNAISHCEEAIDLIEDTVNTPLTPPIIEEPAKKTKLEELWESCVIYPKYLSTVKWYTQRMDIPKYLVVQEKTGVPWEVIAAIHALEGSCNFNTHLHNGDPLTGRTTHVPAGRPKEGVPPFYWTLSAIDALQYDNFDEVKKWDVETTLDMLERYNGLGYRRRNINSPYVWGLTNHYGTAPNIGKYVSDGNFNDSYISKQPGAACYLKVLEWKPVV